MAAEARATTATAVAEDDDDAIDDFIISVLFDRETRLALVDSRVAEGIHRATLTWYDSLCNPIDMRRKWPCMVAAAGCGLHLMVTFCGRAVSRCSLTKEGLSGG